MIDPIIVSAVRGIVPEQAIENIRQLEQTDCPAVVDASGMVIGRPD
jgi:hypothetical protein